MMKYFTLMTTEKLKNGERENTMHPLRSKAGSEAVE